MALVSQRNESTEGGLCTLLHFARVKLQPSRFARAKSWGVACPSKIPALVTIDWGTNQKSCLIAPRVSKGGAFIQRDDVPRGQQHEYGLAQGVESHRAGQRFAVCSDLMTE